MLMYTTTKHEEVFVILIHVLTIWPTECNFPPVATDKKRPFYNKISIMKHIRYHVVQGEHESIIIGNVLLLSAAVGLISSLDFIGYKVACSTCIYIYM